MLKVRATRGTRVGLVTTLRTNVGDDLIRRGIVGLLRDADGGEFHFAAVNKHHPYTVYPRWHPLRWSPRGRTRFGPAAARLGLSRFDRCDVIVQCGGPVLWPGCSQAEWVVPLWHDVLTRLGREIPVLNLAAGSCYPWTRQPASVGDEQDARFLRGIADACAATSVRDGLAEALFTSLDRRVDRIPCAAFLAAGADEESDGTGRTILISYMAGAGHYGWDQPIDAAGWEQTVRELIARLRPRHQLAFLAHDDREAAAAQALDPSVPCIQPRDADEYFEAVRGARGAICNRMHASVALAGMGVPSVAVGTDTRLLMVSELGLPVFYVADTAADAIEAALERLLAAGGQERERLLALKDRTRAAYRTLLQGLA